MKAYIVFIFLITKLSFIYCEDCFWDHCIDCGGFYQGKCLKCESGYYVNSAGGCFENISKNFPIYIIIIIVVVLVISIVSIILRCYCIRKRRNNQILLANMQYLQNNNIPNNYNYNNYYYQGNINGNIAIDNNNMNNNNLQNNIYPNINNNNLPPGQVINVESNLNNFNKPTNLNSDRKDLNDQIIDKEFESYLIRDINNNLECNLCSKKNCEIAHFKCGCSLQVCRECFIKYKNNFKVCPKCSKEI